MGAERIELLVTDLPVEHYATMKKAVEHRLAGTHTGCGGKTVTVDTVRVIPQPLGGLMDYQMSLSPQESARLARQTVLVVDPGQYTTDWLLVRQLRALPARSGSTPNGVARVLEACRKELLADYKGAPSANALADALRHGEETVFAAGHEVLLAGRLKRPLVQIGGIVMREIRNSLKLFEDVDRVVLVGGGAVLFRGFFTEHMDGHNVQMAPYPGFANVRGYLSYANQIVARATDKRAQGAA